MLSSFRITKDFLLDIDITVIGNILHTLGQRLIKQTLCGIIIYVLSKKCDDFLKSHNLIGLGGTLS